MTSSISDHNLCAFVTYFRKSIVVKALTDNKTFILILLLETAQNMANLLSEVGKFLEPICEFVGKAGPVLEKIAPWAGVILSLFNRKNQESIEAIEADYSPKMKDFDRKQRALLVSHEFKL